MCDRVCTVVILTVDITSSGTFINESGNFIVCNCREIFLYMEIVFLKTAKYSTIIAQFRHFLKNGIHIGTLFIREGKLYLIEQ